MKRMYRYIAWLLIAVLTLTGHSMAMARGMSSSVDVMELCAGDQVVMVSIDANGEPTGPAHICPEFSLLLTEVLSPQPVQIPFPIGRASDVDAAYDVLRTPLVNIRASARAPPLFV